MRKIVVKNTIGHYKIVCFEVKRVGPAGLLDWLNTHDDIGLKTDLMEHILFCHRCSQVHLQSLKLIREGLDKMTHEERQVVMKFDPDVCTAIAEHRANLIDWLYSIKETPLFYDAVDHLGICDHCPATDEEVHEVLSIPS